MNYIYGQLNQKIVKVEYDGIQTPTSVTNVDNRNCTIGVDVRCVPHSLVINDGANRKEYDGSNEVEFTLHNYTISKVDTPSQGNFSEYILKDELDQQVGATIEIPNQNPLESVTLTEEEGHYILSFKFENEEEPYDVDISDTIIQYVAKEGGYINIENTEDVNIKEVSLDVDALETYLNIPRDYDDLNNKPSIPSKTSDLTNDSGFITASDIPTIPTKVSDLTNDAGYITSAAIPSVDQVFDGTSALAQSGVAIKVELDKKQDNLTESQLAAVNSGISASTLSNIQSSISTINDNIGTIQGNIEEINDDLSTEVLARQEDVGDLSDRITAIDSGKQDVLEAGANITISNENVISATDTTYTAGNGLSLDGTQFSVDTTTIATKGDLESKQDSLTEEQLSAVNSGITSESLSTIESTLAGKQDELTFDNEPTEDSTNPVTSGGVFTALSGKQDTLTAGTNVTIEDNVISVDDVGEVYTAGNGLSLDGNNEFSIDTSVVATQSDLEGKQDALTQGNNIIIEGNEISAIDTTYDAGYGIIINDSSDEEEIPSISVDTDVIATKQEVNAKQDALTPGTNISIDANGVISSTAEGKLYTAGYGLTLGGEDQDEFQVDTETIATQNDIETLTESVSGLSETVEGKQDALTEEQLAAVNSGITSENVDDFITHISNTIRHITEEEREFWNSKTIAPEGEINVEFNGDVGPELNTQILSNIVVGDTNYKIASSDPGDSSSIGGGSGYPKLQPMAKWTKSLFSGDLVLPNKNTIYTLLDKGKNVYFVENDTLKYFEINTSISPDFDILTYKKMYLRDPLFLDTPQLINVAPLVRFESSNYEWRYLYVYTTMPSNPEIGDFWGDSGTNTLNRYYEDGWRVEQYETGSEPPAHPTEGMLWINTSNSELRVYTQKVRTISAVGGSGLQDVPFNLAQNRNQHNGYHYCVSGVLQHYENGSWVDVNYTNGEERPSNPSDGDYYLTVNIEKNQYYYLLTYSIDKYENSSWTTVKTYPQSSVGIGQPQTRIPAELKTKTDGEGNFYMDLSRNFVCTRYISETTGWQEYVCDFDSSINPDKMLFIRSDYELKEPSYFYYLLFSQLDIYDKHYNDAGDTGIYLGIFPSLVLGGELYGGWFYPESTKIYIGASGATPSEITQQTDEVFTIDKVYQHAFTNTCFFEQFSPDFCRDILYINKLQNPITDWQCMTQVIPVISGVGQLLNYMYYDKVLADRNSFDIEANEWTPAPASMSPFTYEVTKTSSHIKKDRDWHTNIITPTYEAESEEFFTFAKCNPTIIDMTQWYAHPTYSSIPADPQEGDFVYNGSLTEYKGGQWISPSSYTNIKYSYAQDGDIWLEDQGGGVYQAYVWESEKPGIITFGVTSLPTIGISIRTETRNEKFVMYDFLENMNFYE